MPTYKGNVGNLLQHWVLVELISILQDSVGPQGSLAYVDAHAMSPYAKRHGKPNDKGAYFETLENGLAGGSSRFEIAWRELRDERCRYPSSAAFVRHLWKGPLSLTLCEIDKKTADEIDDWRTKCTLSGFELHRGDWRDRFEKPFPVEADAVLVAFDPDVIGCGKSPYRGVSMGRKDLQLVAAALGSLPEKTTLVQLSTYSANGNNTQHKVREMTELALQESGFHLATVVRSGADMMSMVFSRHLPMVAERRIETLQVSFKKTWPSVGQKLEEAERRERRNLRR